MSVRFRFKHVSIHFLPHNTRLPPRQQLPEALLHMATALLDQKLVPELRSSLHASKNQGANAKTANKREQTKSESKRSSLALTKTRINTCSNLTVNVLHEQESKE